MSVKADLISIFFSISNHFRIKKKDRETTKYVNPADAYGVRFVPHSLVINKDGILMHNSSEDPEINAIYSVYSDLVNVVLEYNAKYKVPFHLPSTAKSILH